MPDFYFQIQSPTRRAPAGDPVRLPDHAAARAEAAAIFMDFARNIAADFVHDRAWQIEVLDGDGKAVFRIKVLAETSP